MVRLLVLMSLVACEVAPEEALLPAGQSPPSLAVLLGGGGSSLVPGEPVTLQVDGATPNARVHLVRGAPGGPTCPPPLGGSCVDMTGPTVLSILTANNLGRATLTATIPATLPVGREVVFQAVELAQAPALVSGPLTTWVTDCGNGAADPGEQCDDDNTLDGDGCSAACEVEQEGFAFIVAGYDDSCALDASGEATCWGDNTFGLGDVGPGPWSMLSLGRYHACGVQPGGALSCWGLNNDGQTSVPSGAFAQVSAGPNYTCAVGTAGAVRCWGFNAQNQVSSTPTTSDFQQVSAGARHVCAVRRSPTGAGPGLVSCWGENVIGESSAPSGLFSQVTAGGSFSCGVTDAGTLDCWGADNNGQATPPTAGGWLRVEAGNGHACALNASGAVACWGWNGHGQTDVPAGTYTAIGETNGWSNHHCALQEGGLAVCWGEDNAGETLPPG